MALEIGRLIGYHRIADRMGLIKRVVGKVVDLIIDRLGGFAGDTVCNAPGNAALFIAVNEGYALFFDLFRLFLDMARRTISACPSE